MRPILPEWTDADPALHARLEAAIDPDGKILGAIERIVPISGKRIADVGTGIGHYPRLLARRTGRTYGVESDPLLLAEARRRAGTMHQPNIRIVEGDPTSLPLRDGAVDVVLTSLIDPDDASLPAVAEALRVLRADGRLIVIGFYGRDDVSALLEPEVVEHVREATQHRTGWWLRHGFQDQGRARQAGSRRSGDRARAPAEAVRRPGAGVSDGAASPRVAAQPGPLSPRTRASPLNWPKPLRFGAAGTYDRLRPKARLFSPRSLAFGVLRGAIIGLSATAP